MPAALPADANMTVETAIAATEIRRFMEYLRLLLVGDCPHGRDVETTVPAGKRFQKNPLPRGSTMAGADLLIARRARVNVTQLTTPIMLLIVFTSSPSHLKNHFACTSPDGTKRMP